MSQEVILIAVLFILGILVIAGIALHRSGQAEEKAKHARKENENAIYAARIRDRLRSDDGFASRLRKRFSR